MRVSAALMLSLRRGEPGSFSALCHTAPMRVVIADDHRLVLDGIQRALESDSDFEIVGETQSGTQCCHSSGKPSRSSVLLDVRCRGTVSPASTRSSAGTPTSRS